MDADGNGKVDYLEFVAAALQTAQLERGDRDAWRRHTRMAFDQIDVDGNGYIDVNELALALGGDVNISQIIREADRCTTRLFVSESCVLHNSRVMHVGSGTGAHGMSRA